MAKEKKEQEAQEEVVEKMPSKGEHHQKVSRLSLTEIEKALESVQTNMGGFHSKHAQFLLQQREKLRAESSSGGGLKKAA